VKIWFIALFFPKDFYEGKKELRFIPDHPGNSKESSAAGQDTRGLRAY
jgi:hypothetical protein